MLKRRHIAIALTAAAGAAAAGLAGPVAGAAAATRFAAPASGLTVPGAAPCTNSAKPCLLGVALTQAIAGDDVRLARGSYLAPSKDQSAGAPLVPFADTLEVPSDVVVHGADPADLPVIHVKPDATGGSTGVLVHSGGVIRDVAIRGSAQDDLSALASSLLLDNKALADRVRVETTGAPGTSQKACAVFHGATLRNAVCLGRGSATDGRVAAVSVLSSGLSPTIRNVTAISTSASGVGLELLSANVSYAASISNSILRGTSADLSVKVLHAGIAVTAALDHSNWVSQGSSAPSSSSANLVVLSGNQTGATAAEPKFVDEDAGDFRELADSSTIDAGVVDVAANGPFALGGANRVLGATTDMGAFELQPAAVPPTTPEPTTPQPTTPQSTTPAPTAPQPTVDPGAGAGPVPGPGAPLSAPIADRVAPTLTGLGLSRSVKRTKGTSITFSLSEAANVVLAFGQPKAGRSVGGKCRATTAKNRKQPRCTIPNVKGMLTVEGRAGANTVSFRGNVASGRRLALGSYTLEATPTDAAGNRGLISTRKFSLRR